MTRPRELRRGVRRTPTPGIFYTPDGRYFVRVTFSPSGEFREAAILLSHLDDYTDAIAVREQLREQLITAVAPVEVLGPDNARIGVVFRNKVVPVRPLRKPICLPPRDLFE